MDVRPLAKGLEFPEGPVALADGSVLLVQIAAGAIARISPDGTKTTVARPGGGPNGAAIGPHGKCQPPKNRMVSIAHMSTMLRYSPIW